MADEPLGRGTEESEGRRCIEGFVGRRCIEGFVGQDVLRDSWGKKCEAGQGKRQTSLLADNKALPNRPAVDDADFAARMDQKPTALSGLQRQLLVQGHALIYGFWPKRSRRRKRRDRTRHCPSILTV